MGSGEYQDSVVRALRPEDRARVLTLRKAAEGDLVESGREDYFDWQYFRNPAGHGVVTLVEVAGEVVGELGALPTEFKLDTQTTTAAMYVNFIVRPDLRGRGLGPDLDRLQREQELARDLWLMLGFIRLSNPPQVRVQMEKLKRIPFVTPRMYYRILRPGRVARRALRNPSLAVVAGSVARGPLALWNLVLRPRSRDPSLQVRSLAEPEPSLDDLWARVSSHYRYAVIKDCKFLAWRYFEDPRQCYRILGAYRGSDLAGLAVMRVAEWERLRVGVILDLLVEPGDRKTAACLVGAALDAIGEGVDFVSCMLQARGAAGRALSRAGFVQLPSSVNPHEYLLIGQALDGRMDLTPLTSSKDWYVSWGDFDVF